jgi:nicotinamidase/pyrazinamidase
MFQYADGPTARAVLTAAAARDDKLMSGPPETALLIVDVQNDFCSGGALAVPDGTAVIEPLNACIARLSAEGAPIYASRDWHPPTTRHFEAYGGRWPPHCIAGTDGAAFHHALALPERTIIVTKGNESGHDGYSAFEGRTSAGTTLTDDLRSRGITHLVVGGLATDYCVQASVLDARRAGFEVTVLADAIRGVDLQAGDSVRAVEAMKAAGARLA